MKKIIKLLLLIYFLIEINFIFAQTTTMSGNYIFTNSVTLNNNTTLKLGSFYIKRSNDSMWIEKPLGTFIKRIDIVNQSSGSGSSLEASRLVVGNDTVKVYWDGVYFNKNRLFSLADTNLIISTKHYVDSLINNLSPADQSFDATRAILRVPTAGKIMNTTTLKDWVEWWYYVPSSISLTVSGGSNVEVGTSNIVNITTTTLNPGGDILSEGKIIESYIGLGTILSFENGLSSTLQITYTPQQNVTSNYSALRYSFLASQKYNGIETGTTSTNSTSINAIYPVFYGVSTMDLSNVSGTTVYTNLTKTVTSESSKSYTLTGTGYAYIAIPKTWSDYNLSSIIDHNGFNVMDGFSKYDVTITSVELDNNYTDVQYVIYKSNFISTYSDYNYTFNR